MKTGLLIFLLIGYINCLLALDDAPKREFRAVWIASVVNLDWPGAPGADPAVQRTELISILDAVKESGFNAVVFQIRPECDALYDSPYEPWSYWLTGVQGQAPFPYYDPLAFAVSEAHKRGMELHAWFNPYRAERSVGSYPISTEHVSKQHPDWTIQIGTIKFLDPGLPMVREFVTDVVLDVVNRYDVDGIHFDDYFYPYPPNQITNQDQETYNTYPRGFTNVGNWRRDNVNLLVAAIYDSIQAVKPHVKFGISPFGIWKNGVPQGTTGLDAYNVIYCDAVAWMQNQILDYLTPQLYWPFGGGQDYELLLPWWAQQTNNRHLYPGQGAYRISSWSDPSEMPDMIRLNRQTEHVYGSVFFRVKEGILDNPKGFNDSLKTNFYRYPALLPAMTWKDETSPNTPANLRFEPLADKEAPVLRWDLPETAADGDSASRYVIYRFAGAPPAAGDMDNPANILGVAGMRYYFAEPLQNGETNYYFAVSALDRNYNESDIGNVINIAAPTVPVLVFPENQATGQPDTVRLSWRYGATNSAYDVEISGNEQFSDVFKSVENIRDTSLTVSGFSGQTTYFWRAKSSNPAGTSDFSDTFQFSTGFPPVPLLASPLNGATDIGIDTVLVWHSSTSAAQYRIQLAKSVNFQPVYMVLDTVISDTTLFLTDLDYFARFFYYWRVAAGNDLGSSGWSEAWQFKTIVNSIFNEPDIAVQYMLGQNYPNPFNPETTIPYSLAQAGPVTITIYNLLGQKVRTLVDDYQTVGLHTVKFDARDYSSGVYIYRIVSGTFSATRKFVLIK